MPAKRIIVLSKHGDQYQYVLWADVPAGNQQAYRNPAATSAYQSASVTEVTAIREGLVTEKAGVIGWPTGTPIAQMEAEVEAVWTEFQASVTAAAPYIHHGRYWNGTSWVPGGTVPMRPLLAASSDLPSYWALTGVSAFAANKLHFVLSNGVTSMAGLVVRVRLLVVLPQSTAVVGVLGGDWTIQRRDAPTTAPAGGAVPIVKADTGDPTFATLTAHNAPTTAPAGGTLSALSVCTPQPDEVKVSTLDLPGLLSTLEFGGQIVYAADRLPLTRPWTLHPNQTLELVQSATAGLGNCRVLCVFTVG